MEDTDKIKLKFEAIWKARDIELNAVRERTLLAWGFLMFCYGAYGYLFAKRFLTDQPISADVVPRFDVTLLFLSLICLRLSAYWAQMAKGAKAWAELFEYHAESFEHVFLELKNPHDKCPRNLFSTENGLDRIQTERDCAHCNGDVSHACVFSVLPVDENIFNKDYFPNFDCRLLTTKGGAYSPAKVMIAVARLSLCVSFLLVCAHLAFCVWGAGVVLEKICWKRSIPIAVAFLFLTAPAIRIVTRIRWVQCLSRFILKDLGTESTGLLHMIQVRNFLTKRGNK